MKYTCAVAIGALVLVAVVAGAAGAHPREANGRIAFARFNPLLGDTQVYTINSDGSGEHLVSTDALECPRWSPDGARLSSCGDPTGGVARIVNPDEGSYRVVPATNPDRLFLPCWVWSRDGTRLACEGVGLTDPALNGIYTVRTSDGGGLARVTTTPGGDDAARHCEPDDPDRTARRMFCSAVS